MEFINLRGIVVRETYVGEADKYIDLFTDKLGKVTTYVKRVRSSRAHNLVGVQLLNYCEYMLIKKKDRYYISSSELIESFYNIREDVVSLTYAAHFLDVINSVICEDECQTTLLKLLLNTLYVLAKGKKDKKLVRCVFELRLLKILGYEPYTKACISCGGKLDEVYFDVLEGGVVCSNCRLHRQNIVKINKGTYDAIKFIMTVSQKDIFKFELDDESKFRLSVLSKKYLQDKLDKVYNKLDFLEHIN